jgi:hypothetical protein
MAFVPDAPKLTFVPDKPAAPAAKPLDSSFGHTLLGEAELGGAAVGNLLPNAINSANDVLNSIYRTPGAIDNPMPTFPVGEAGKDLVRNVRSLLPGTPNGLDVSDEELRDNDPTGKTPIEQLRAEYAEESAKPLSELMKGTVGGDLTGNAIHQLGNVANILPIAGLAKGGANVLRSAATTPAGGIDDALNMVGYKNLPRQGDAGALATTGAKITGEQPLAMTQTLNNQAVTDTLAKHEAGVPQDADLEYKTIAQARADGPGKVYDAARAALPVELTQSESLSRELAAIGDTTSQLPRSPNVEELKQYMLDQPTMTRDELFSNIQQARDKAAKFYNSTETDAQAMGDAYQGVANAYENFVGERLAANPNSPVSLADWQDARTAFAKNYAVQTALRGTSVDASKLAALQRKDPERLTGGLRLIAEQNNRYPLSTGFGPTTFEAGGVGASGTPQGILARHVTGPLLGAGVGSALGGPAGAAIGGATGLLGSEAFQGLIRRALGGSPELGATTARRGVTDPRLFDFFDRPEAPNPLPPFPGPQGPFTLADELGAGSEGHDADEGLSLADVLSHNVEQPPAQGLTAGPMGARAPQGIPFSVPPESVGLSPRRSGKKIIENPPSHIIGVEGEPVETGMTGVNLQDPHDLIEELENLRDNPEVGYQNRSLGVAGSPATQLRTTGGVPEGTMIRTQNDLGGKVTNEAANRDALERASGQDRFLVDPDGKMWPIRGIEAADATAPRGSIIIQKGVGAKPYTIMDRGGLPQSHAEGLLNRALAGGTGFNLIDLLQGAGG